MRGLPEVPHQHAALAQRGGELRRRGGRDGGRRRSSPTRAGPRSRASARPRASASRLAMMRPRVSWNHASSSIAATAPAMGEAIERIGVEAVLHPLQRLDQRPLADREADSQAGQRARLGEGLDDQQIVVARHQRHGALGAEVDIGLVDHHQLVRMLGDQRLDLRRATGRCRSARSDWAAGWRCTAAGSRRSAPASLHRAAPSS